jgi:hypothetical protein
VSDRDTATARIIYVIATISIGLGLTSAGFLVVFTAAKAIGGNGEIVTVNQTVRPHELDEIKGLNEDRECGEPECVHLGQKIPVQTVVLNGTRAQVLMENAPTLLFILLSLTGVWILRNLVDSVRREEPFNEANVTRLRKLGLLLAVGYPVADVVASVIRGGLADSTKTGSFGSPWNVPPAPGAIAAGLVVLVLAQVFAHGVRLREDVESTI